MIANYHTHTVRCRHAQGTEEELVRNAIARGLKIFGFSDHTPQWFPGDYYSTMRMYPDQLEEYCSVVRQLQERYKGQLEIPLGVEVEYYPDIFRALIPRLRDAGIQYILLGQHWIGNEENEPYCGRPTESEEVLRRYCDQAVAGMETGLFSYLAHPDLLLYLGDRRVYESHMRRICRAAIDTNTPLEMNLLGIRSGRHYPNPEFWALVAEEGCPVILGIDAHSPQEVADLQPENKALKMLNLFGITPLETVPLKPL